MPDPQPPPPREALFAPYRALGVVSSGVPLALRRAGAATFATAAVGKAWIVYECGKLKTAVVGPLVSLRCVEEGAGHRRGVEAGVRRTREEGRRRLGHGR
jgi:hypothetical protein